MASTYTPRELPIELLYPIFDALLCSFSRDAAIQGDKHLPSNSRSAFGYTPTELEQRSSFKACSLVCKRWNTIARPYVFDTLALQFEPEGDEVGWKDMSSVFTSLASSSSPAHQVRYLRIIILQGPTFVDVIGATKSKQIRYVLSKLPHLHTVELVDVIFEAIEAPRSEGVIKRAPMINLDTLSLVYSCELDLTLNDILMFMSWCSKMNNLSIRAPPATPVELFAADVSDLELPSLARLSARSLDIRGITAPGLDLLAPHLISSPMFSSPILEEITFGVDPLNSGAITSLLAGAPDSLSTLTLDLRYLAHHPQLDDTNAGLSDVDLAPLEQLKRLTLIIPDEVGWKESVWTHAKSVLRNVLNPSGSPDGPGVQSITIDLDDIWDADPHPQKLDVVYSEGYRLSRFQYNLSVMDVQLDYVPTLTRFELKGFLHLGPDSANDLKAMMPRLSAKGIVYVTGKSR